MNYATRTTTVTAEQFTPGEDITAITNLTGTGMANVCDDGTLQVKTVSGDWVTMQPGYWVVKWPDGCLSVSSGAAFARLFTPSS
jgi:hypothetical protein